MTGKDMHFGNNSDACTPVQSLLSLSSEPVHLSPSSGCPISQQSNISSQSSADLRDSTKTFSKRPLRNLACRQVRQLIRKPKGSVSVEDKINQGPQLTVRLERLEDRLNSGDKKNTMNNKIFFTVSDNDKISTVKGRNKSVTLSNTQNMAEKSKQPGSGSYNNKKNSCKCKNNSDLKSAKIGPLRRHTDPPESNKVVGKCIGQRRSSDGESKHVCQNPFYLNKLFIGKDEGRKWLVSIGEPTMCDDNCHLEYLDNDPVVKKENMSDEETENKLKTSKEMNSDEEKSKCDDLPCQKLMSPLGTDEEDTVSSPTTFYVKDSGSLNGITYSKPVMSNIENVEKSGVIEDNASFNCEETSLDRELNVSCVEQEDGCEHGILSRYDDENQSAEKVVHNYSSDIRYANQLDDSSNDKDDDSILVIDEEKQTDDEMEVIRESDENMKSKTLGTDLKGSEPFSSRVGISNFVSNKEETSFSRQNKSNSSCQNKSDHEISKKSANSKTHFGVRKARCSRRSFRHDSIPLFKVTGSNHHNIPPWSYKKTIMSDVNNVNRKSSLLFSSQSKYNTSMSSGDRTTPPLVTDIDVSATNMSDSSESEHNQVRKKNSDTLKDNMSQVKMRGKSVVDPKIKRKLMYHHKKHKTKHQDQGKNNEVDSEEQTMNLNRKRRRKISDHSSNLEEMKREFRMKSGSYARLEQEFPSMFRLENKYLNGGLTSVASPKGDSDCRNTKQTDINTVTSDASHVDSEVLRNQDCENDEQHSQSLSQDANKRYLHIPPPTTSELRTQGHEMVQVLPPSPTPPPPPLSVCTSLPPATSPPICTPPMPTLASIREVQQTDSQQQQQSLRAPVIIYNVTDMSDSSDTGTVLFRTNGSDARNILNHLTAVNNLQITQVPVVNTSRSDSGFSSGPESTDHITHPIVSVQQVISSEPHHEEERAEDTDDEARLLNCNSSLPRICTVDSLPVGSTAQTSNREVSRWQNGAASNEDIIHNPEIRLPPPLLKPINRQLSDRIATMKRHVATSFDTGFGIGQGLQDPPSRVSLNDRLLSSMEHSHQTPRHQQEKASGLASRIQSPPARESRLQQPSLSPLYRAMQQQGEREVARISVPHSDSTPLIQYCHPSSYTEHVIDNRGSSDQGIPEYRIISQREQDAATSSSSNSNNHVQKEQEPRQQVTQVNSQPNENIGGTTSRITTPDMQAFERRKRETQENLNKLERNIHHAIIRLAETQRMQEAISAQKVSEQQVIQPRPAVPSATAAATRNAVPIMEVSHQIQHRQPQKEQQQHHRTQHFVQGPLPPLPPLQRSPQHALLQQQPDSQPQRYSVSPHAHSQSQPYQYRPQTYPLPLYSVIYPQSESTYTSQERLLSHHIRSQVPSYTQTQTTVQQPRLLSYHHPQAQLLYRQPNRKSMAPPPLYPAPVIQKPSQSESISVSHSQSLPFRQLPIPSQFLVQEQAAERPTYSVITQQASSQPTSIYRIPPSVLSQVHNSSPQVSTELRNTNSVRMPSSAMMPPPCEPLPKYRKRRQAVSASSQPVASGTKAQQPYSIMQELPMSHQITNSTPSSSINPCSRTLEEYPMDLSVNRLNSVAEHLPQVSESSDPNNRSSVQELRYQPHRTHKQHVVRENSGYVPVNPTNSETIRIASVTALNKRTQQKRANPYEVMAPCSDTVVPNMRDKEYTVNNSAASLFTSNHQTEQRQRATLEPCHGVALNRSRYHLGNMQISPTAAITADQLSSVYPVENEQYSESVCATCNTRPAHFCCSGCNGVHYCSENCQKLHWNVHCLTCRTSGKANQ